MPRLFSAESNVSGFQSVGPEATANAGSPHAASIGAGSAPIGGQHPGQPVLNAGGRSFLQARQFPGPKKPADQPGTATATVPPASRISGTGGAPPGPGGSLSPAAGSGSGSGTSGWNWTAKVASGVSPSFGGAAYNGGGGPLAGRISGTGPAPIGSPKVIQGSALPPNAP